ncbi:MAG: S8 family serine peptidase [Gemmatimonadetes bacterium]|nr:S8 family serine peptidase [Gemmatimonadota bacterium]
MRRTLTLSALATALFVAACQDSNQLLSPNDPADAPAFSIQRQVDQVVPGRILARLVDGADAASVGSAHGVAFERTVANGRIAIFNGAVGNERALAARLGGDDRVVYAEPDYLRQTTAIDAKLWAFHNPGGLSVAWTRGRNKGKPVTSYLSVEDADEDNHEGYASGGGPVSIASIDTGVQMDHPEFGGVTFGDGWDYIDNDADPSDENDHGTHTTGTMVGDSVGVAGVAGAASNVTVYVFRVCGANGCPTSAIVSAIYAATDSGVVAMNISLGGGSLSQFEADAIFYATDETTGRPGALVIASAGNGGTSTVSCPACDTLALSVAASDWLDEHAYYTNYGEGLDITAPGGELYSNTTSDAGIYSSVRGSGYAYFQGTSMAAPQVTGTAAIVASVTGATGAALRSLLEGTTDDLGAPGYDTEFGWGRLNSYRAVMGPLSDPPSSEPDPDPLAAGFTFSCSELSCSFDASGSTGSVVWDWTFGDSTIGSGVTVAHKYPGVGTYTVTLTVGDGSGNNEDTTSDTVSCKKRGRNGVRCN